MDQSNEHIESPEYTKQEIDDMIEALMQEDERRYIQKLPTIYEGEILDEHTTEECYLLPYHIFALNLEIDYNGSYVEDESSAFDLLTALDLTTLSILG